MVRVETRSGLATGYAAADGTPLTPEIIVSSKARLRPAMATALRTFAAATPIMAAARAV
jgi:Cu/Ag efflux pump CusA